MDARLRLPTRVTATATDPALLLGRRPRPGADPVADPVTDAQARLRDAIQAVLDEQGDGWDIGQYVLALGLERIRDGVIESTAWVWAPPQQPEWQTDGLLLAACDLRDTADTSDIDD